MKTLLKPQWTGLLLFFFFPIGLGAMPPDARLARSVVKVMAHSTDGKNNMGSGVIIADNKVATNCHVTRKARQIFLVKSGQRYLAIAQAALPEFDVCLLQTKKMPLPKAALADGATLKVGQDINIYGYPMALGMRVMNGAIVGLYPYRDQKVIEINAGFMQGASGGGVFNRAGELIGLTTFMGKKQHRYHFYVIPVGWLSRALSVEFQPIKPFEQASFWESGKFQH